MLRKLNNKDFVSFYEFCLTNKDIFSDFYINREDQRIYLNNENILKYTFNHCLKHKDQAFICEDRSIINGILLIIQEKDKKFIKISATSKDYISDLLTYFTWNCYKEAFIRIKKKNPIVNLLNTKHFAYNPEKEFGFQFSGVKNEEIIFKYIPSKRNFNIPAYFYKDEDK